MHEGIRRIDIKQKVVRLRRLRSNVMPDLISINKTSTPSRNTLISESGNILGDAYLGPEGKSVWEWKSPYQLAKNERKAQPIRELKILKMEKRAAVRQAEEIIRIHKKQTQIT